LAAAGRFGIARVGLMDAGDKAAEVGDKSGEGQAQGLTPRQQHIVVSGKKVTRTSCRSSAQAPFHAVALWGIAHFLGDGEADTGIAMGRRSNLQPKRRTPGAIAPGGPGELRALPEAAQAFRRLELVGRHPASSP
jgi:hypothetical protein